MSATATRRRRNPFGMIGKYNEIYELFKGWRDDDDVQEALAEEYGWELEEGTGAPEGRADLPLFFLTQTRHKMREGFTRRAAKWQQYVGTERAEDFRQHTVSQLNGLTGMGPVEEFGEYPRVRSSEEMGPPYAVGKHGGIYGITFEMVVDDDANTILNRTPRELGRMNAAYMSRVVIALIEGNGNWIDGLPFFSASARPGMPNGNEVTGAAAEPTEDNVMTLYSDIENTEDGEGFPMDIEVANILTRERRTWGTFQRIFKSTETGSTTNDPSGATFDKGRLNVLSQLPRTPDVIVEPYLRDPNDWIVLAETGRPAFIVAYLRDQREPFVGIEDPGVRPIGGGSPDPYTLDYDEIKLKIRNIFGVAQGDPRSARRARRA